jgi:uncharacterized membrane protein YgdD (TMEM256/DUF423 family)
MAARTWIFLAALLGGLSVAAGAIGAHAFPGGIAAAPANFRTAQLYQALHALALLGVGLLLLQTRDRRARFSSCALQIAAAAFTLGILCFSGGIYTLIATGIASVGKLVPVGGTSLIVGWVALAIAALGLRT